MTTRDLLERRASIVSEMRQITDHPADNGGDLSAEQGEKFNNLKAGLKKIEAQIEQQRFVDEAERRMNGENITGNGDRHLDRELRNYSFFRAIAGKVPDLHVDDGFEREVDAELRKKADRPFKGMAVPLSLFTHAPRADYERRIFTSTAPAGGPGSNIIPQDYRADQFIDILRPNSAVYRMGATLLTGLQGNVAIPRLKVSSAFAWFAENAALSAVDPQVEQVTLTPKHGGIIVEFSRNLLLQSSPDVEQLLRMDMSRSIATGIDKAAVNGGGSNEPTGILATSGIGDVPGGTNGLAPTWANVLALIAAVQNANGSTAGFLTTPNFVAKARSVVRVATTDSRMIMEEPATLAGYPVGVSTNVPNNLVKGTSGAVCSALIFGDFSEVLIGVWSELDVLVNPYAEVPYSKGNVEIRAAATLDVKLKHPLSFAATKDVLTT